MLEIEKIISPAMDVNSYIIWQENSKEAIVIDPSFETAKLLACLQAEGLQCRAILLTHGHFDHIAGVKALKEQTGAEVAIHRLDAPLLTDAQKNLSAEFGAAILACPADRELEQSIYTFAGLEVKVLHTPGHSEGSVCYFIEDALFSGDTLFNLSIGRTDFPGSSWPQMQQSLEKFKLIEGEYAIYPGHGHSTSLAYEVDNNPYLGEEKWSLY